MEEEMKKNLIFQNELEDTNLVTNSWLLLLSLL